MRTTKNISIDRVSLTLTGLSIYGNDGFLDWIGDGVKVSRILNVSSQMQIILKHHKNGIVPKGAARKAGQWFQSYGKRAFPDVFAQKFGQTAPVNVQLLPVGNHEELIITLPTPDKRKPLMRGRHKSSKALPAQLDLQPPPPPGLNLAREIGTTEPRKDTFPRSVSANSGDPLIAVRELVNDLNRLNKLMSGSLKVSMDGNGQYYASVIIRSEGEPEGED